MSKVVGYYLGPQDSALEQQAVRVTPNWSVQGRDVLLWQRDGLELERAMPDRRRALHHLLFLLRAQLATYLWVPVPEHLGSPAQREIVLAESWRPAAGSSWATSSLTSRTCLPS